MPEEDVGHCSDENGLTEALNCIALESCKVCFPLQPVFFPVVSPGRGCQTPVVPDKGTAASGAAAAAPLCLVLPFHSPRTGRMWLFKKTLLLRHGPEIMPNDKETYSAEEI